MSGESTKRILLLLGCWLPSSGGLAAICCLPAVQGRLPAVARFFLATDLNLQDRLAGTLPALEPEADVVFLGIDSSSLSLHEEDPEVIATEPGLQLMAAPFPWSRELWALAIQRILESGARLVVLDLLFDAPREGDAALREVLTRYPDRVILSSNLPPPATVQDANVMSRHAPPSASLLPEGDPESVRFGYVNFWPDLDGQVRKVRFHTTVYYEAGWSDPPDAVVLSSLSAATLAAIGELRPPATGREHFLTRTVRNLSLAYQPRPIYEIFWPSTWKRNYREGAFFRDKIVMIGPAAPQSQDIHHTPHGSVFGPLLHLNAISAARQGGLYLPASMALDAAVILLIGLAGAVAVAFIRRPGFALAALAGAAVLFLLLAWAALRWGATMPGLFGPLSSLVLVGGSGLAIDYGRIYRERLLLRRALERRVSAEVMEEILANPSGYLNQLGGVRREVVILFSDLRGFTKMSEAAAPEEMVARLNGYFDRMVDRIQTHRGLVDKFIGDAIMAVWGSVPAIPPAEGVRLAIRSALEMDRALRRFNETWFGIEEGAPGGWSMGIGIHRGEAITGNIGSEKRLELTAIGDAVNLASRIEGVTKRYGVPLVVSDAVTTSLEGEPGWVLRPIDRVRVVGRRAPVTLHQPLAAPGDDPDALARSAEAFREAFAAYLAGQFADAAERYAQLHADFPQDTPASLLLERCRRFAETPPAADWAGAIDLDSK